MPTSGTFEFRDAQHSFTICKKDECDPINGLKYITKAAAYFEFGMLREWHRQVFKAASFAADFVAVAHRDAWDGVTLSLGRDSHPDTDYHYTVTHDMDISPGLLVTIEKRIDNVWSDKVVSNTREKLTRRYNRKPKPKPKP